MRIKILLTIVQKIKINSKNDLRFLDMAPVRIAKRKYPEGSRSEKKKLFDNSKKKSLLRLLHSGEAALHPPFRRNILPSSKVIMQKMKGNK